MRILAIVVTYFPGEELLKKNVSAFVDHVEKVLIWENTSETKKFKYRFIEHEKVEYCGDGINSISHALNYAWHYGKANGYDYLLTMDQDSVFTDFLQYKNLFMSSKQRNVIFSPLVENTPKPSNNVEEIEYAITSGMIVPIDVLNTIGGYRDDFRIDGIDLDLCLKAKLYGIRTFVLGDTVLKQQFGTPLEKKILNKTVHYSCYPAQRLYSIYKSHTILMRQYDMSKNLRRRIIRTYLLTRPKCVILYEDQKLQKIIAIIKGVYDGFKYKIH